MKKFGFILFVILGFSLAGCNNLPDDVTDLQTEFCEENTDNVLCNDNTEDLTELAIKQMFDAMVVDYNDGGEFNCAAYFNPNNETLTTNCINETNFFGPDGYQIDTVLSVSLFDTKVFTVTTETDHDDTQVEYIITIELEGERLYIDDWEYRLIEPSTGGSSIEFINTFIEEYNDASLDSNTVCSKYISDSIEASNCAMIRNNRLGSGSYLEFVSETAGLFYVFNTRVVGTSGSQSYVLYGTEGSYTIRETSSAFYPTNEFDQVAYSIMNDYANDNLDSTTFCNQLDSEINKCKQERDGHLAIGFYDVSSAMLTSHYDGTMLKYILLVDINMDDSTILSFSIIGNVNGSSIEYYIDFGD